MKLRFFIPGGAGYIGSVLTESLLQNGHYVHVVDNFFYSQSSLLHLTSHADLKITVGDIRDRALMQKSAAAADVIIPLAALVGAPLCNREPILSEEVNLHAPLALFDMISDNQILLMPTTNSAYGSGDSQNYCDENSPLNPISSYARMKVAVENKLMSRENAISFRLATVFGVSPRMRLDLLVNDFTYRAIKHGELSVFEGHFKRNYIHIRDVVRAFLHAVDNFESMKGQIYNVGLSSANISKLDLCQLIANIIPAFKYTENADQKDPDQRNYIVSNRKIENTGYSPRYSLEDGIREIVTAYPMLNETLMKNI